MDTPAITMATSTTKDAKAIQDNNGLMSIGHVPPL